MACGIYNICLCIITARKAIIHSILLIAAIVWAHLNFFHNDGLWLSQRFNSLGVRTV